MEIVKKILITSILSTSLIGLLAGCDGASVDADKSKTVAKNNSETSILTTANDLSYPVVDTNQKWCFSDTKAIECGKKIQGQDAQYDGLQAAYQDNGDGTVTDLNTGLMWIKDAGEKVYYSETVEKLKTYSFAGYDDWRLPTIKELYSLAQFSGVDASMANSSDVEGLWPLIDDDYFTFLYGDKNGGQRVIDSQWLTSSVYVSHVYGDMSCFFGFNFSDGRIKCYGLDDSPAGGYFAQFVRGNTEYGTNKYVENGDKTITDKATGLTWTQNDNGKALGFGDALNYCEALSVGSTDKWRLPNIKELHTLVDYSRSPDTTNSATIDPLFNLTPITNEAGQKDYGQYWSSTTLISYPHDVAAATYISFGRAMGYDRRAEEWIDVHGAGAQRSDPKVASDENVFEFGHGPQGDTVRRYNYALCVTGGAANSSNGADPSTLVLSNKVLEQPKDGDIPTFNESQVQH